MSFKLIVVAAVSTAALALVACSGEAAKTEEAAPPLRRKLLPRLSRPRLLRLKLLRLTRLLLLRLKLLRPLRLKLLRLPRSLSWALQLCCK